MKGIESVGILTRIMRDKQARLIGAIVLWVLVVVAVAVALSYLPLPSERLFISQTGYTLFYPADWVVEEVRRDSSYASELIREPNGRATIAISSHSEPRLRERTGRAAVAKEIELAFIRDQNYHIDFFGWLSSEIGAEYNGYVASGLFKNEAGRYAFREIGILDPKGTKVTFRTEVLASYTTELNPVVEKALLSIRSSGSQRIVEREQNAPRMSAEEAKALVERLPDFALYQNSALERGMGYTLEAEDAGELWNVRLYVDGSNRGEILPIPVERWRVDKATGAVSKVLP